MAGTPPNIVYIHSHDTGRYVQPYGHGIPTPNIQLLADQGVLFREAFSAAPTCSGSRASLLTGQYCHQNGMLGLAHRGWSLNDNGEHWIHALRPAGYHSSLIGEQHVAADPASIGYDVIYDVDSNHAENVVPAATEAINVSPEPFFLSVGFFETHRSFAAPTSVRDTLYSQPPEGLPDTPLTRDDVAAFKASARSLDQGIGAVLNALQRAGLADRTLVVCTTDHGLAFPNAKATLYDRGTGVMLIMRGPNGFTGGKVVDSMVSHLDVYPTLCEVAGVPKPDFLEGESLLPLVRGEVDSIHDEIFTEMTFHAAYQPQRAVRTKRWKYIRRFHDYPHPVLANCDDSATKDIWVENGWGEHTIPEEQLYDLLFDPTESRNVAEDPANAATLERLRGRLDSWLEETDDPIRLGPISPPPGAIVSAQTDVSPSAVPSVMVEGEGVLEGT